MNELLTHAWGVSRCTDRIWSQVAGMAPSVAHGRRLLVLHVYVDESWKDGGYFALAGFVAPVEKWAKFSVDWEEMLPWGVLDSDGRHHFKMSEMTSPDGLERMQAFWRIIEKYVDGAVAFRFRISDLHNAMSDVFVGLSQPKFDESDWGNPYFFACRNLLNSAYNGANDSPDVFPENETISFIFDDRSDRQAVREVWDWMRQHRFLGQESRIDADPRFENDRIFLPLQAADLWAWWVRYWTENNIDIKEAAFPNFDGKIGLHMLDSFPSRETIAEFFAGIVQDELEKTGRSSMVFIRRNDQIVPYRTK